MNELRASKSSSKREGRARGSVLRQLAALQSMDKKQLEEKWRDLYGSEPPQYKKQYLIKRLAFRIQEILHGGISKAAKSHLKQIAGKDPVATLDRRIPEERKADDAILPGTRFVRVWRDHRYEVVAAENGFDYDGRTFRSLSAIAREITGTRWNGRLFFGLKKQKGGGSIA